MLSHEARKALEAKYNLLTKAANTIRKPENWCVGSRDNGHGAHCALGAIDRIYNAQARNPKVSDLYSKTLADLSENIPVDVEGLRPDPFNGDYYFREAKKNPEFDRRFLVPPRIARYNNVSSHAEVIAWFDKPAAGMKCILDKDDAERLANPPQASDSSQWTGR